jgi:hypothetical protein
MYAAIGERDASRAARGPSLLENELSSGGRVATRRPSESMSQAQAPLSASAWEGHCVDSFVIGLPFATWPAAPVSVAASRRRGSLMLSQPDPASRLTWHSRGVKVADLAKGLSRRVARSVTLRHTSGPDRADLFHDL